MFDLAVVQPTNLDFMVFILCLIFGFILGRITR